LTKLKVAGMRETVRKSAVWRRYSQFKALDQCVHALPNLPHPLPSLTLLGCVTGRCASVMAG